MAKLEVEKLKSSIVAMGEMCEYIVASAMTSLVDRDAAMAKTTQKYDDEIDEMELNIDRQCRHLILSGKLDQQHTNFVLSAHKINNDLERIGDNAVHIAGHVLFLVGENSVLPDVIDLLPLLEEVNEMISSSVTALLEGDTELAWKIVDAQLVVHEDLRRIFHELIMIMRKHTQTIERASHILFIAQALQRIADLAVNIAEEVVFNVEGKIVRHHLGEYHPAPSEKLPAEEIARSEQELLKIAPVIAAKRPPNKRQQPHNERWQLIKNRAQEMPKPK